MLCSTKRKQNSLGEMLIPELVCSSVLHSRRKGDPKVIADVPGSCRKACI